MSIYCTSNVLHDIDKELERYFFFFNSSIVKTIREIGTIVFLITESRLCLKLQDSWLV